MGSGASLIKLKWRGVKNISKEKPVLPAIRYATYEFSRKCQYVESHNMYVPCNTNLDKLPPPHSPHTRKNEIFDLLMYEHIDKWVLKVPSDAKKGTLENLVEYITKPCKDDLGKIRAIYTWLTSHDLAKMKKPLPPIREGTVPFYLTRLKSRKANYAQLISLMCRYANIECVVIHGYLKGSTYEIGQSVEKNKDRLAAEWNAVLIDKVWRFINAYWGACAVGSDTSHGDTMYGADNTFFLPEPDQLIYSHFPEEKRWQLLERPLSMKDFEKKALLKERFFELEMRVLSSHTQCEILTESGEVEITFGIPEEKRFDLQFMCLLFEHEDGNWRFVTENKKQHDFIHFPNDNSVAFRIRFPNKGKFKVELVGKDCSRKEVGYDYDWIAIYKVTVKGIRTGLVPFPKCAEAGWGPGRELKQVHLTPGEEDRNALIYSEGGYVEIEFEIDDPSAKGLNMSCKIVTVNQSLDDVLMDEDGVREHDDRYIVEVDAPPGVESALCIFAQVDDPSYGTITKNIVSYLIISSELEEVDDSLYRDIEAVRQQLEDAIEEKKLEPLERAVDLVETKHFEKYMPQETELARDLIARLRKIQELLHAVLALDQRTIAEIRAYSNPLQEIHNVLKATLLLLGTYEDETKLWKNVQAILGRQGKDSLKRRINDFELNNLSLDIALGAKKLLGKLNVEEIKNTSIAAATFGIWVMSVVEEVEFRNIDRLNTTIARTTKTGISRP